jgi:hypothetical protein
MATTRSNPLDDNTDFVDPVNIGVPHSSSNPFYLPYTASPLKFVRNGDLRRKFSRVLILCLTNNFNPSIDGISDFFTSDATMDKLRHLKHLVTIVPAPFEIVNNNHHRNMLIEMGCHDVEVFLQSPLELKEVELVCCMLDVKECDVRNYCELYANSVGMKKYIGMCLMSERYEVKSIYDWNEDRVAEDSNGTSNAVGMRNNLFQDRLITVLNQSNEFDHWGDARNCDVQMNVSFSTRQFVPRTTAKDLEVLAPDVQTFIASLMNSKSEKNQANYIDDNHSVRKDKPHDLTPSETIKRYNDANKLDRLHYFIRPIMPSESTLSREQINELFMSPSLDEKEKYYLLCNLLISKDECHHIINNRELLIYLKPMFNKYYQIIRYLFGYAWMTFYLEETIRKTRTEVTDRYVVDLETACELPTFPMVNSNIHMNPYIMAPISTENINSANNVFSTAMIQTQPLGLCDLLEFKRRLNLYTSGNANTFILEGVSFDNMAITGSCMTAILPKFNPLMRLFTQDIYKPLTDSALLRFFKEYYATSDMDVACNHRDLFDFIDHVNQIYLGVKRNLKIICRTANVEDDVKLIPNKTLAIHVNEHYLKEEINKGNVPFTLEQIINGKDTYQIKNFFYEMYYDLKRKQNLVDMDRIKSRRNAAYDEHLKHVIFDNTSLVVSMFKVDEIPHHNFSIHDTFYILRQNSLAREGHPKEIYMRFKESMKFKIESKLMPHSIEVFRINYDDYFSAVARFHLPCVRAYYNGKTCYMLPSAITAYMTFLNIDYKYFVGNKDPVDIINKNRMRGFGTLLNKFELNQMLQYCCKFSKWSTIMDIDTNKAATLQGVMGTLPMSHPMFRPNRAEDVSMQFTVDTGAIGMAGVPSMDDRMMETSYCDISYIEQIRNSYDFQSDMISRYDDIRGGLNQTLIEQLHILPNGKVQPIKRWLIDMAYDLFH